MTIPQKLEEKGLEKGRMEGHIEGIQPGEQRGVVKGKPCIDDITSHLRRIDTDGWRKRVIRKQTSERTSSDQGTEYKGGYFQQ